MHRIDEIRKRFISEREKISSSQSGLSKWLKDRDIIVSQQNIFNFETGAVKKVPDWLREAAKIMEINYEWLLEGKKESSADNVKNMRTPPQTGDRLFPLNSHDLIPMYGAVLASSPEVVHFTEEYMIEEVPRHPAVQKVKGAFAMQVSGDSMAPRHFPGERVYINPHQVPHVGQDCIIVQHPDGNAILKRFMGESATEWKFSQLNPAKELTIEKSKVRKIYAVVR